MVARLSSVCVLAAVVAVASAAWAKPEHEYTIDTGASYAGYGDYKDYNTRPMTPKYLKCAGVEGKPYVHYAPCEDGFSCVEKASYSGGDWGRYCLPTPAGYGGKCYESGVRCMGAPGKPFVEYHNCCTAGCACMEKDSKTGGYSAEADWGSFCLPYHYEGQAAPEYVKPAHEGETGYNYRCHISGAVCGGAPGYPYQEAGEGCCDPMDVCVTDGYTGWRKFCKPHTTVYDGKDDYSYDGKDDYSYGGEDGYGRDPPTWYNPPCTGYGCEKPEPGCKGYGCETPEPACKGYDCPDTTNPGGGDAAKAFGLGPNFGCGGPGAAAASATPLRELSDGEASVTITIPITPAACPAFSLSQQDADALVASVCAIAGSADPSPECFLIAFTNGAATRMLIDESVLDSVVRQGGGAGEVTVGVIVDEENAAPVGDALRGACGFCGVDAGPAPSPASPV
jgi:hypothetical protein